MLWENFEKARWSGVRDLAHEKLYPLLKDPIPEVRAAAVFALGTFICSVTDRSEEHANNIDRIIAITLLENVSEDMSPLVRLELAAALQWMVLLFESQFVTVYLQEHMSSSAVPGDRSASISHTTTLGLGSTASPGGHAAHGGHQSTHSLERHATMRRGVSSSSISNINSSSIPFQSIFLKLLQGINQLGQDPFPKVAETAQKILNYIKDAALCLITAKEATTNEKCISLSVSLPPSPNTRVSYLGGASGESPPVGAGVGVGVGVQGTVQANVSHWASKLRNVAMDPQAMLQRKLRTTSMNDETDSSAPPPQTPLGNEAGGSGNGNAGAGGGGDGSASGHSSASDTNYASKPQYLKSIVTTDFIPWAISYFTRPGKHRYAADKNNERVQVFPIDINSPVLRARKTRYQRNDLIRMLSREQQSRSLRIDTQSWVRKTQSTPSIVKLLPYEQQIAVAYREKVLVYDWRRNTVRTFTPCAGGAVGSTTRTRTSSASPPPHVPQYTTARVSSIEFLNAQDVPLTLVGHEDGVVRIWESNHSASNEESTTRDSPGRLVTAFVALPALHAAHAGASSSSSSSSGLNSASKYTRKDVAGGGTGMVSAWQQCTQQLVVAGGSSRFLRIWDVEKEYRISDIPIGSEHSIRLLAPFPSNVRTDLIIAGCGDGSVRLYDRRCATQESRIRVYREHTGAILSACLKNNQTTLLTGCSQGKVCVTDLRSKATSSGVLHQWDVGSDVTAIAAHQSADLVAAGSANKITIYSSQQGGRVQNTLRSNESFMGPKIGHPTCLAFHSYKMSLAVGFVDNMLAVYEPSSGLLRFAI